MILRFTAASKASKPSATIRTRRPTDHSWRYSHRAAPARSPGRGCGRGPRGRFTTTPGEQRHALAKRRPELFTPSPEMSTTLRVPSKHGELTRRVIHGAGDEV
jgi:hypothetical protein